MIVASSAPSAIIRAIKLCSSASFGFECVAVGQMQHLDHARLVTPFALARDLARIAAERLSESRS